MTRIILTLFCLALAFPAKGWTAQDSAIEQLAKDETSSLKIPVDQNQKLLVSVQHETGWVKQGSRQGRWALTSTTLGLIRHPAFFPFAEVDLWDRLGERDYTASLGGHWTFKDSSALHASVGFGGAARYLARFKSQLTYQHRLIRTLHGNLGGRYLHYAANDVFIATPGLVFYFGDNDISLLYNHAITESRGEASSGVLRSNIVLNSRLSFYAGAAAGHRLYDIFELSAADQFGYIGFAGFAFKINDMFSVRAGFSYATEKPNFIKRSLEAGFSAKF